MAKKLIVLYGPENTGKTETLNRLIGLLDESKKVEGGKLLEDRRVIAEYKEKGKKIAIATKGDGPKEINENISFFDGAGECCCDIFITAIRIKTSHPSNNLRYKNLTNKLKELFPSLTVDPIQKKMEESRQKQEEANRSQAKDIKAFIDEICNESEKENSSQE